MIEYTKGKKAEGDLIVRVNGHQLTFKELADKFIKKEGKIYIGTDEEIVGHYMTDHDQMIKWHIYHENNANLQVVDRGEHQRKKRNG